MSSAVPTRLQETAQEQWHTSWSRHSGTHVVKAPRWPLPDGRGSVFSLAHARGSDQSPERKRRVKSGAGRPGSDSPLRGITHPLRGVDHPFQGVDDPLPGTAHPFQGVDHPFQGVDHSFRGVDHPLPGTTHPFQGVTRSLRGTDHPFRGVTHSFPGVDHPLRDRREWLRGSVTRSYASPRWTSAPSTSSAPLLPLRGENGRPGRGARAFLKRARPGAGLSSRTGPGNSVDVGYADNGKPPAARSSIRDPG